VETRRAGVAAGPLRAELEHAVAGADRAFVQIVEEHLRAALARPGSRWQRGLRRVTGFLMGFLPIVALMWVGYNVVVGYYRASAGKASYLGTDFAVSSILLVAVAWAVPLVCDRLLRPSLERAAAEALRSGCDAALDQVGAAVMAAVDTAHDVAADLRAQLAEIDRAIAETAGACASLKGQLAGRLVVQRQTPVASADGDAP